jgi:sugar/nucleoside kinase (ribokinase family)
VTVVVVGDIVTDVLAVHSGPLAAGSDTPAEIRLGGGGAAANTAAWLAGLGVPVTLVGVVGTDAAGAERLAELAAAGVRCAVRRAPDAPTGSVVVLSGGGERTMLVDRGANALLTPADVEPALARARHLHLSGYTLLDAATRAAGLAALAFAHQRTWAATASVDAASAAPLRRVGGPAFLSWVRRCSLLFANADEAAALLGVSGGDASVLAARLATTVPNAIVKRGAAGAVWADSDGVSTVPATAAHVVDPTGAGDAFAAGVLAAWLAGAAPATALAAGADLGARAVSQLGARPTTRRR